MSTHMIVTRKNGQHIAYVVTGAPALAVGADEIKPHSVWVEGGKVTLTGQRIGPDGTTTGPFIDREYTIDQAPDLPGWCEPVRSRFIAYAEAISERNDCAADYDQAFGGTGLTGFDLAPYERAYSDASRDVTAAIEALYA